MDNVERFEQMITERQAGLQDNKRAEQDRAIGSCVEDMRYLTGQLEYISGMDTASIINGETSTSLRHTVGLIRDAIATFYTEHQEALAIVLPFDQLEKLDPLFTRFVKAIREFEARAVTIISALERFEHLITGTRN